MQDPLNYFINFWCWWLWRILNFLDFIVCVKIIKSGRNAWEFKFCSPGANPCADRFLGNHFRHPKQRHACSHCAVQVQGWGDGRGNRVELKENELRVELWPPISNNWRRNARTRLVTRTSSHCRQGPIFPPRTYQRGLLMYFLLRWILRAGLRRNLRFKSRQRLLCGTGPNPHSIHQNSCLPRRRPSHRLWRIIRYI